MSSLGKDDLVALQFYWQDADGGQNGPSAVDELRAAWKSKNVHGNCYVFADGFDDWMTVDQLPVLQKLLAVPPPPPKNGASKKIAPKKKQSSSVGGTKTKKKAGWTEKRTCDGVPYYVNGGTGELTWNKPESLLSTQEADAEAGVWKWVPDDAEGWVAAQEVSRNQYRVADTGETVKLKKGANSLDLVHASLARLHDDLVLLDSLDEGLILHNLRQRYSADEIYTAVGGILVAINPFQRLPLYTTELIEAYHKAGNKPMAPHPYKLADAAYKALLEDRGRNQSILVSGESGSGKTETTKQALSFLAEVAGSASSNIEQRVLSANPILEAFGNAKTTRNDNSSRFGRFTAVQFDNQLKIAGASINNYLLEKSRVKGQSEDERNYHVFYQLCAGDWSEAFAVESADAYGYLDKCLVVDDVDDNADFAEVVHAMDSLGLEDETRSTIYSIVAAVVKLGQVGFEKLGGMSDGSKVASGDYSLAAVGAHLGADLERLEYALTHRTLSIRGQKNTAVQLRVEQSLENRDALAKYVYANLFDFLVQRVNRALEAESKVDCFIGILDIFGFEIFKINSFEQLCINFTNEKLQQLFNEHTFKTEEAVYRAEGVDFPPIAFIDNQPVCDLIEKRGGIFTLLDDIVKGPGKPETKDSKFSQTLDNAMKSNEYYVSANEHRGVRGDVFSVRHYAASVCYSCDGFVEKNADTLYPDLYDAMSASTNELIASMFPPSSGGNDSAQTKKATLGASFRKQLASLMETLRSTEPHYVRCIKPNQFKQARLFEGRSVLDQLTCAGVFEAVKIRKQGYPFRFTYERFVTRYKSIMSTNSGWVQFQTRDARSQAEEIITVSQQPFPELQRGRTMLLFRADEYRVLELCRALAADRVSAKIQAKARGQLTRRYLEKVQTVRPALRKAVASRDLHKLEKALAKTDEALGVFAQFDVAVPIGEWATAKRLVVDIKEALRLAQMLQAACEPTDEDLAAVESEDAIYLEALMQVLTVDCAEHAKKIPIEPTFDQWYEYASQRFANAREARLSPRFDAVMKELEREPMSELYAEAKRLGYETPHLAEIESLVEMSEEALLKKQYARAHETGQADRARQKEIALKEHYLDQYASMFVFERFALLRDQSEYNAAASLFVGHKAEKKETMLQYSKHKLLTSMTTLENKADVKTALKNFRSVMGFMGEKQAYASTDLCVEVVGNGLANPSLRPEIYCQLIKQLTNNPSPESSSKGWTLCLMCLLHFPPGSALENYLHIFIRKHAPVNLRKVLTKATHDITYQKTLVDQPPSSQQLFDMVQQAQGASKKKKTSSSTPRR